MRNLVNIALSEFIEYQSEVRDVFKIALASKDMSIFDKLQLWEKYAQVILPLGSWLSDAPKTIQEYYEDLGRGDTIRFTDLADLLSDEGDTNIIFDEESDEVIWLSDAAVALIEEVFATGLSGTRIDW